ncbi:30S ribosomal protein S20 [Orrella sp. 11846]|uniref:30S ribosomal protein S20 n=1 Tax=Orrella sp. 11846 TaxID=3409913 RepID=UPI003B5CCD82
MANSPQARKRARQNVASRAHNGSMRSMMRTYIKRTIAAINAGDQAAAMESLRKTTSVIDRVADKKIIHKNKAARHKSRLNAAVKAMGQAA